jgi:hypothetical protein
MENDRQNISTKFTIASEQGIALLKDLTRKLAREKFAKIVAPETLENYIHAHFNRPALLAESNNISTQWLVVYVNGDPAGYARITSSGKRPKEMYHKTMMRIADFAVLNRYHSIAALESLYQKCLNAGKGYQAIWINEYKESPYVRFFESMGFAKQDGEAESDELPIPSVYLVKEQNFR